jgi:biopolymer transport protein ExbB/TolQ
MSRMTPEVLAAIVTSAASLVIAIGGLISSTLTNRRVHKSNVQIESMKLQLERAKATDQFADHRLLESCKAVADSLESIQKMRDALQLTLTSALDSSLDIEGALKDIAAAREHLFSTYQTNTPYLADGENKAVHRAKNLAHAAEVQLRTELASKRMLEELSPACRSCLSDVRSSLGEEQNLLRDSLSKRLLARLTGGAPT